MSDKRETYSGFWMQLGCVLSIAVVLSILAIIAFGIYFLAKGF